MNGTSVQYGPQYYFRHPYTTHYLHAKFTRKCTLKILIHLFIYVQWMSKSSTFKAIKVCCSLITPFTSFTTVFLKIQRSASNLSEIYPHEKFNSREACFNPYNTFAKYVHPIVTWCYWSALRIMTHVSLCMGVWSLVHTPFFSIGANSSLSHSFFMLIIQ